MITATAPACRCAGHPLATQARRMAARYAAGHPASRARIALVSRADDHASLVNDLGGQDPYPRYGADQNDIDTEGPDD